MKEIESQWLRLEAAAQYLGISKWSLYQKKDIEYSKNGRLKMFKKSVLDKYLEDRRVQPKSERKIKRIANGYTFKN